MRKERGKLRSYFKTYLRSYSKTKGLCTLRHMCSLANAKCTLFPLIGILLSWRGTSVTPHSAFPSERFSVLTSERIRVSVLWALEYRKCRYGMQFILKSSYFQILNFGIATYMCCVIGTIPGDSGRAAAEKRRRRHGGKNYGPTATVDVY